LRIEQKLFEICAAKVKNNSQYAEDQPVNELKKLLFFFTNHCSTLNCIKVPPPSMWLYVIFAEGVTQMGRIGSV
jgi:hypothetical protein